ncbi:MAG TPA: tRNA (adenosine(37)-N6)-dimethylallyltransferase MiaA [Clostridiaceae bacterium]|jgi:tRNA dimethylallyltransferase|nr:tRNA (adenosine(37)-N6)-dimethylallyltransferase MiaA [Clostridiaceae bacterium]
MPDSTRTHCIFRSNSFCEIEDKLLELVSARPDAIPVITGPTATGKSSMAFRLAQRINGEIVNGDAMQIYRGFDIGTAKPSLVQRQEVVHHMYDIRNADELYSVAMYVEEATILLRELLSQKRRPIICGGSVQYISALLDGLQFHGRRPDLALRERIGQEVEERGVRESWQLIYDIDPEAASAIAPVDRRRIVRFFELHRQTGLTKTELNRRSREQGPQFHFLPFRLDWFPRTALYKKINMRTEAMYNAGLLSETHKLMQEYPNYHECPAFRGIGYREAVMCLEGDLREEEARKLTAQSTRRYAKRQQTWLRRRDDLFLLLYVLEE